MSIHQEFLALAKSKFCPGTTKMSPSGRHPTSDSPSGMRGGRKHQKCQSSSTSLPRATVSGKSFRPTKSNHQPDLLHPTTKAWPLVLCPRPLNTSMLKHPLYEEIILNVQSKHPLAQLNHAFKYIYILHHYK